MSQCFMEGVAIDAHLYAGYPSLFSRSEWVSLHGCVGVAMCVCVCEPVLCKGKHYRRVLLHCAPFTLFAVSVGVGVRS